MIQCKLISLLKSLENKVIDDVVDLPLFLVIEGTKIINLMSVRYNQETPAFAGVTAQK